MKHTNFITLVEADWGKEYSEYLKGVARHLDRIFQRKLTMAECYELNVILKVRQFTLRDGTIINGDDDQSCLGNRAAAALVGCFHDSEERHDAQWWYVELLSMNCDDERLGHQLLGEIVAHPSVASTP